MGTDAFSKLPLSGAPHFTAEPQEMALPTSMAPPVQMTPMAIDQQHPPIRSQYPYVDASTGPQQLSIHTGSVNAPEHGLNIPRYVDNPRPSKSPRHNTHPSLQSANAIPNNEASPEYRYGQYAPVNIGSHDVAPPTYNPSPTGPSPASAREYYSSPTTWTSAAGEPSATVAYANNDGRSFSFSQDQYKATAESSTPVKPDPSQPPIQSSVYSAGPRGSFDAMNHYSWSGN